MTNKTIRGTISELLAMGLTINGEVVTQSALSTLTRLGMARKAGEKEQKGRGKAATVWELSPTMTLELHAVATKDHANAEAVAA